MPGSFNASSPPFNGAKLLYSEKNVVLNGFALPSDYFLSPALAMDGYSTIYMQADWTATNGISSPTVQFQHSVDGVNFMSYAGDKVMSSGALPILLNYLQGKSITGVSTTAFPPLNFTPDTITYAGGFDVQNDSNHLLPFGRIAMYTAGAGNHTLSEVRIFGLAF